MPDNCIGVKNVCEKDISTLSLVFVHFKFVVFGSSQIPRAIFVSIEYRGRECLKF